MSDAIKAVEDALSPKTFDIVEAVQGKAYPTEDVTVFFDEVAIRDLRKANKELTEIARRGESDEELEDKVHALADKVQESANTFTFRGVSQKVIDEATEKHGDSGHDFNIFIMQQSLVKVTNTAGAVDDREFTFEDMKTIYYGLPQGEYERLQETIMGLSFAATIFDEAVDAGFLQRR